MKGFFSIIEFDKLSGLAKLSIDEIDKNLKICFGNIPEILGWNEPKKEGNDPRDPDNDFIDLDALARNISHSLILEEMYHAG